MIIILLPFYKALTFHRASRSIDRQVFLHVFLCSFFEVVFHLLFDALFVASSTVFGLHVGSMLGAFSSFFRSQDEVLSRSPFGIVF